MTNEPDENIIDPEKCVFSNILDPSIDVGIEVNCDDLESMKVPVLRIGGITPERLAYKFNELIDVLIKHRKGSF